MSKSKVYQDEIRDTDYINSLDKDNKRMYLMLERLYFIEKEARKYNSISKQLKKEILNAIINKKDIITNTKLIAVKRRIRKKGGGSRVESYLTVNIK